MTAGRGRSGWLLCLAALAVIAASAAMLWANPYTTVVDRYDATPTAGSTGGGGWVWGVGTAAVLVAGAVLAPRRRVATAVVASAWTLPEWAGWSDGPAWARVAAGAAAGLPVVVTTVLAVEVVGVTGRARFVVLAATVAGAAVVLVTRLTLVEPFADPGCWRFCGRNPLLVASPAWAGPATGLALAALVATAAVTAVVLAVAAPPWPAARVTATGAAVLVVGAGLQAARPGPLSLVLSAGAAVVLVAGLAMGRAWEWRLRRALGRLIDDLGAAPAPGALSGTLAVSVGDPGLRVLYWDATRRAHLDAEGRPAGLPPPGRQAVTSVVRGGEPVAVVVHRSDVEPAAVEEALGPAARLWLRNEQLRATTLAGLGDLRASEARIAERSAEERRRLERNLHDGVQQRVVGIALLLRMLRDGDGGLPAVAAERAGRCASLLDALLDDLRGVVDGEARR